MVGFRELEVEDEGLWALPFDLGLVGLGLGLAAGLCEVDVEDEGC